MTTKRNGVVEKCRDAAGKIYFRGRVWLEDGSLSPRFPIPEEKRRNKQSARNHVDYCQEVENETHAIFLAKGEKTTAKAIAIVEAGETCDQWFKRFHAYAKDLGQTDAEKKRARWNKWIAPTLGPRPIATITRDQIEDVRDALDRAIQEWKRAGGKGSGKKGTAISGKTAMNVWSCLTSSFKAATTGKRRDLRVLDGKLNPCLGVEPPGDKDSRQVRRKTFLYPKEAAAILTCELIPLEWREVYAVALYTYLRPGELRVLTWSDVDLASGLISITKAWDYQDEKTKPPKTRNGVRNVPIEPSLAPLLERLHEGKEDGELVVPRLSAFGEDHLAEQWRRHLKLANVTRPTLHGSTLTHVQSNFRSCRDTGITWLAMGGLGVDKIMRRAGHDTIDTTMGYVKLSEDLGGELGVPFGPLPSALTSAPKSTFRSTSPLDPQIIGVFGAGGGSRIQP